MGTGRPELPPGTDIPGGPDAVDDWEVLDLLAPPLRDWWVEQFGDFVPENDGFFTPPQEGAIPLIHEGENALIAAPTGSGKCVRPDTPLIIEEDGEASVLRAEELLDYRDEKVADVDEDGELYESDIEAVSLSDGELVRRGSMVYSESYSGDLHRIETVYGREVEVTPDHPLLVETSDGQEWRRAEDISEGDRIGVPSGVELPSGPVTPNVAEALATLDERFSLVLTEEDAARIRRKLDSATVLSTLSETDVRAALTVADISMREVSDRLSICISSVHRLVTGETDYRADEFLDLLRAEARPLDDREVIVKTHNGRVNRFRYPERIDEEVAMFAAFVLAEGYIGEYDGGGMVAISQNKRTGLLEETLRIGRDRFGVDFRDKNGKDHVVDSMAFALFLSELLDIARGAGRDVRFPDWILNASDDIKRTFVSTFLSLEGEIRKNEIRVVQSNEMKIEQLTYLLLSFGILSSRRTLTKYASNTETQKRREYYGLTVRGKPNLRQFLAEFEVTHQHITDIEQYADGGTAGAKVNKHVFDYRDIRKLSRYFEDDEAFNEALGDVYEVTRRSGYITERALGTLFEVLSDLPADEVTTELSRKVERLREQNVTWLEVTGTETVGYEGEIIDLSVPDTHNFVGGRGGLYLHNTLASFTAIINELYERDRTEGLENAVYCLYVSPLRSLANDIHRNLERPLAGVRERADDEIDVRHAIRHGDTSSSDRQAMLEETPHILNTTPETLAILLNAPKFREKLRTVEYVVVDEIHSLADNKRGTHLSVSLERLERLAECSPTRVGCSATVEPLDGMAEFLVGRRVPAVGSEEAAAAWDDEGSGARVDGASDGRDEQGSAAQNDGAATLPTEEPWPARECEVVDARFVRDLDVELVTPAADLVDTPRDVVMDRFYDRLGEMVAAHDTTIVFTNTRSGAERVLHNLREGFDRYDEENSACHHGSLARDAREDVERRLKDGDVDVVTTSTSLELGIDMPTVDLVVQVGSPKSVAALLQRVGRAGHQLGETVTGRVVALDRDELVECAVMLKKATEGFVDRVFVPERAQDVAAQHVYGMAINGPLPERDVLATLRRAYPYRDYDLADFEQLLRYLTADYPGMEDRDVYAKVWRDENDPPDGEHHYPDFAVGERLMGKRGRLARPIYMQNIGTIPDSFTCDVHTRAEDRWAGQLDEEYLDTLEPGDVFVLGGDRYEYRYRRGSKVYVDPTSARPTVPSWYSERLPLAYDLGREILAFRGEVVERLQSGGRPAVRSWLRRYPIDDDAVRALARLFDQQVRYVGPSGVSTTDRLAIEEELDRDDYKRRFYVHSNYGRRFNDGLSRVIAYECAQATDANVAVAVADHGFSVSMPLNRKVDIAGIVRDLDPAAVRGTLRRALADTDLLQRYFRINAARSLMILKRYKGYEKSASEQQVSSEMLLGFAEGLEDFAVIEETYREILEDRLDVAGLEAVLERIRDGDIAVTHQRVDSPSPLAFGLATLMASDVVLAEDESAVLQRFHERVVAAIEGDGAGHDGPA